MMHSVENDSKRHKNKFPKSSDLKTSNGLDSIRINYDVDNTKKPKINPSKRKQREQDESDNVETPKQKIIKEESSQSNNKEHSSTCNSRFDECNNKRISRLKSTDKPRGSNKSPVSKYENDLLELKQLMKNRKKQFKKLPKLQLQLRSNGREADLTSLDGRTPILPCDVQNLLLLSQLAHYCPRKPRWIKINNFNEIRMTVVMVVEGVSAYDFLSTESNCPTLHGMDVKVEMVSPYSYNSSIIEELSAVSLTQKQKKSLEMKFGREICTEALTTQNVIKVLRSAFSISLVPGTKSEDVEQKISVPTGDKFPRTELLLSAWQLIEEGYPLPYGSAELVNRYSNYIMTKEQYAEVTAQSPMWGLDCEMCLTCAGNELTRVSIVNEQHETVYESFCLPFNPIKDYLTQYSGITPVMLKGVTTRLADIQKDLRKLLPPDVILVGQSLCGDLHALKMMHPYIIDTSVIFNLTGERRRKSKLSKLAMEFLNEAIQQRGAEGHDSVEDSLASLKLVQHKLTKSIEYGDAVLSGLPKESDINRNDRDGDGEHRAKEFEELQIEVGPTMATSLYKHFAMKKKKATVIGHEEVLAEYATFLASGSLENKQLIKTKTTQSNPETIETACRSCKDSNFTLAHTILDDEEDITTVDRWMKTIVDSAPCSSLCIGILVGSHNNFSNGACFLTIKRPDVNLIPSKKTKMDSCNSD